METNYNYAMIDEGDIIEVISSGGLRLLQFWQLVAN